ncbi:MAG: DUF5694 domain-containing protein [Pseudomonadota bacterium]
MTPAFAQTYRSAFQPDRLNDRPVGAPNEVMVLGTPHLRELPDTFKPEMVEPLVARLVEWKPTAIASEGHSGLLCDTMRRQPARHGESFKKWCSFDPTAAGRTIGMDVIAANAEAERMLADWPEDPDPAMRRRLAAIFLAAGELDSALVQWFRLPENERAADEFLVDELAVLLVERAKVRSEATLISARVAAEVGLDRLWEVDDQAFYVGEELLDDEAYAAAIMTAWDNPAAKSRQEETEALIANLADPNALMEMYRIYNALSYAARVYASDFGAALQDPSAEAFGRRYLAYWETRNLRMVANIREVLGRQPGTRMLAIVGVSHKPYYEAYLEQMRDVKLADPMKVLR